MSPSKAYRSVLAAALLVIAGLVVFTHFHGFIFSASSGMSETWKAMSGQVSTTANNNNYVVSIHHASAKPTMPALPDISQYTVDNIAAKVPPFKKGKIAIVDMRSMPDFRKFLNLSGGVQLQRLSQMIVRPQAIVVQEGNYDFSHLYEDVQALEGGAKAITKDGGIYTLHIPLLVARGAALTISGQEVRLLQERSTFLADSGDLYMLKAKIIGWSEKKNQPAPFIDKRSFRPFVVVWSGAHMYAGGSTFANLGYLRGKSYGLTFSTCRFCLEADPTLVLAMGVLVGNTFTQMYYGFYSYEADDVVVVGNTYANNVVYGIDPHDRSRRLIIAKNEAYGSASRHGIIISREVDDSWIFDNYSHDNAESGIVLDRTSARNVIANNITARNTRDGITFFESPHNLMWGNKIYANKSAGVRIRNSWDITLSQDEITDNVSVPVVVYAMPLDQKEPERDVKLDPYIQSADAILTGLTIKARERKAAVKLDNADGLTISGTNIISGGPVIANDMFADETDIVNNLDKTDRDVVISRKTWIVKIFQKVKRLFS